MQKTILALLFVGEITATILMVDACRIVSEGDPIKRKVHSEKAEIVGEISPEVKKKNDIGYLNCTVVNKGPGSVVVWSKYDEIYNDFIISKDDRIVNGANFAIEGLKKFDVQSRNNGNQLTYMLEIRHLQEEDAGKYTCTIRIKDLEWKKWPSKMGHLIVQTPPWIRPLESTTFTKDIGADLQLSCSASGIPTPNITWRRVDGKELPGGGLQFRGSKLNLKNIQLKDRGNYLCVADNNISPADSLKIRLSVFYPPQSRTVQHKVGQVQNRRLNAEFKCIVAGNPQPDVRWEKQIDEEKVIITDNDKYDIKKEYSMMLDDDEVLYTLLIKNIQANDYAFYNCAAINRYGESGTEFELFEIME